MIEPAPERSRRTLARGALLFRWVTLVWMVILAASATNSRTAFLQSVKTVQNHAQNILTKLQLRKRYELMRYAIQRGLDRAPD